MTVAEIVLAIHQVDEHDDLKKIRNAIQGRSDYLASRKRSTFEIGDIVRFTVSRGRNKGTYEGEIVKINRKNIKVLVPTGVYGYVTWTVHPNLLEHT